MSFVQRLANIVAISLLLPLLNHSAYAQTPAKKPQKPASTSNVQAPLPLNEVRTFVEVFERIKSAYVEPIDDKTLMDNAIKGMLSNLDPHSTYLDPKDYSALEDATSGKFGGLGIEIEKADDYIKIITPIDDSPAAKAGIQPGDLIIKINDYPTQGITLNDAVEKMRGKIGESIELTIVREGEKPFAVSLVRDKVNVRSVRAQILESNYGYIRISQFQVNTGNEVKKALAQLKRENGNKKLHGIILDLRNNPGGVLQSAVTTVDQFVKKSLIVYTKGRMPNSELRFYADSTDASENVPMVVLINNGSASAAEIVAGALQDVKRAIIMGTNSFGKGSVQTILPINKTHALKLTTALYYTPNGRSIQAQGISPDIIVEQATITTNNQQQIFEVREADLQNHLNNANGGKDKPSNSLRQDKKQLQDRDYQLNQALSLLKGLNTINQTNK